MPNPFYNASGTPITSSQGYSAVIRAEFAAIAAGFALMPATLTANKAVVVNSGGTALTVSTGDLVLNGSLTVSNNLTLTGTNGASINFGAGGTVLYTSSTYVVSVAGTANEITSVNVAGAVTLSLPAALTFTGKTVTGGTFASPTISGTVAGAHTYSGALTLSAALTYGGVTLSNAVTGTGPMVLGTAPALTNPTVGTQTAQDNSTKGASTAYVDRAAVNANVLINGDFRINTRVYVSAAALAAGIYGHDRWKGGASGGTYSFTQLASSTQITIAASKSLIQVVKDKNVGYAAYVLSWTGTATARYAVNGATPSGNFAVSPILISGQTPGSTMSVEFTGANAVGTSAVATNTGTLSNVKLEAGIVATAFVSDDYAVLVQKCRAYCRKPVFVVGAIIASGWSTTGTSGIIPISLGSDEMQAIPNITIVAPGTGVNQLAILDGASVVNSGGLSSASVSLTGFYLNYTGGSYVIGQGSGLYSQSGGFAYTAEAEL